MARYRCSIHTGPTIVEQMGRMIRRAGLRTPIIGTERVYVDISAADHIDARIRIEDKLLAKYGRTMGLKPQCGRR